MTSVAGGPAVPGDLTGPPEAVRPDRWLVRAIPLLLVVVATTQVVAATTSTLTPWRGGGFGMFSTVDAHGQRIVHARVGPEGRELPIDLRSLRSDRAVDRAFVTARAWPTDHHLELLATAIAGLPLVVDEGVVRRGDSDRVFQEPATSSMPLGPVEVITVTVARIEFDRDDKQVTPVELASVTIRP